MHPVLFIFSFLLLWLKVTTSTSVSHGLVPEATRYKCIDKERDALLDFKAHIQDPSGILNAWTSEKEEDYECCKWNGVTCNNYTGHVTRLDLSDFQIRNNHEGNNISPSLLSLSYLSHLNLARNSFNGTIPLFIGSMTHLSYLDLSSNSFSGSIPTSIGSLTKLRYLILRNNSFSGSIPVSIGYLIKLTRLDLSYNYLLNGTCIPTELGSLTNLQYLSLRYLKSCTVENIDWLPLMSHLNHLNMDGTSLAKANKWVNVILSHPKLSYLSLWGCDLSHVIHPYSSSSLNSSSSSIVSLNLGGNNLNSSMYNRLLPLTSNKLRTLILDENMLDGKSFGNLCSLQSLYISYNSVVIKFSEFLNNWSGCTSIALQYLDASHSQFTGSLSDEIQMFKSLEYLNLDHNKLNGPISEKVWELPKLQSLDISSNYLRDGIFDYIGKSKLRYIDLSNNSLKVGLSEAHMSNLSYVNSIDLSSCKLGPRFPRWIQSVKNLTQLSIANNRISDTIPIEFWSMWPSQLTYLNLSANKIYGNVPDLISNFDQIYFSRIDLSSNNFYGHIPNVPSTLVSLDLSRNKFHGGVSFLCQISHGFLRYLDLSHNSFSGKLPNCLWHFKNLEVLNIGYNNLFGRLPPSIESLIGLEVLSIHNNNFSGKLSLSLKNCTKLTFLDLGANKFTGNVPRWIGENLSRLYVLSLTSNKLLGPIPLQLCQLANLQILDLSMNNLYGTIPSCMNNFSTMVQNGFLQQQNVHRVSNPPSILKGMEKFYFHPNYVDHAMINWLGYIREFSTNLRYFKGIDLSRNNLTGQIPYELTDLHELIALNVSTNALVGKIPWKIGEMRNLLALDLSRNNLSGEIPSSMSKMNLLSNLDVSYNNLSGRIPSSTQLQTFDSSKYIGNVGLCGLPLTQYCPGDKDSKGPLVVGENKDDGKGRDELWRWFYIGGATGLPIGFWIVCGTLLLIRRARYAFYHFLDSLQNLVYVKAVVFIAKLQRFSCK